MPAAASAPAWPTAPVWRRDDRPALLLAGMVWTLVVLMIVPEGLDYGSLGTTGAPVLGSAVSRALWLALLLLGSTVLLLRAALGLALLRVLNPFLLPVVVLAVLSLAWSIDPALSARRLVRLVTIVVVSLAFVLAGWQTQRLQRVLRPILTLMLLGSVLFAIVAPTLAIHQESASELAGAWRGLANHKNGCRRWRARPWPRPACCWRAVPPRRWPRSPACC
jgi:exopolysaccharide production protein ExoQ